MSEIENILNNPELTNEVKLHEIRKELRINPRPEDVPVGEAWRIEWSGEEYDAIRKHRCRWVIAYGNFEDGFDPDHHEVYDSSIRLVKRLVPDPGNFAQAVKDEAERMSQAWKEKFERQLRHTSGVQDALSRRNDQIDILKNEVERLRNLTDADRVMF